MSFHATVKLFPLSFGNRQNLGGVGEAIPKVLGELDALRHSQSAEIHDRLTHPFKIESKNAWGKVANSALPDGPYTSKAGWSMTRWDKLGPIRVLASVIQPDYRFLVCPGGKVREGESDLDAARRELREELGVEVTGVVDDSTDRGGLEDLLVHGGLDHDPSLRTPVPGEASADCEGLLAVGMGLILRVTFA